MSIPITKPMMLPSGPALETKELPVTTNEPHPIAVPTDRAKAPKMEIDLMFDFVSIIKMTRNYYITFIKHVVSTIR